MRIAIYGVSAAGKDYLIDNLVEYLGNRGVGMTHVPGSTTLNCLALRTYGQAFPTLDEDKKEKLRACFADDLIAKEQEYANVIVDGHFSFYAKDGSLTDVFTASDLSAYDLFFYLDTDSSIVAERLRDQGRPMPEHDVRKWQDHEIEGLSDRLLDKDKELHVIRNDGAPTLAYIRETIEGKWNSRTIAKAAVGSLSCAEIPGVVCLVDCDKTLIEEDTTALLMKRHDVEAKGLISIYERDRYTNYQCYMAAKWLRENMPADEEDLEWLANAVTPNERLLSDITSSKSIPVVAITAGSEDSWCHLISRLCPNVVLLRTEGVMSKYVKYFVTRELQKRGHFVVAIGDSLLDSLMLAHANRSYVYSGKGRRGSIELMLKHHPHIRQFASCRYQYPGVPSDNGVCLVDCLDHDNSSIAADVAICKSSSGSTGRVLRNAHRRLGGRLGRRMASCMPSEQLVVVAMMRSGLPLAEGIADELDCPLLFFTGDTGSLVQQINENGFGRKRIVLVDGVINTGASLTDLATELRNFNIAIAASVVSSSARIALSAPLFSARVSDNSYVGSKQWEISDGKGPDTADRLFRTM